MSELKVVYAKSTANVGTENGSPVMVIFGTHWPADDPVVLRYPNLFSEDPQFGLFASVNPNAEEVTTERRRGPGRPKTRVE